MIKHYANNVVKNETLINVESRTKPVKESPFSGCNFQRNLLNEELDRKWFMNIIEDMLTGCENVYFIRVDLMHEVYNNLSFINFVYFLL